MHSTDYETHDGPAPDERLVCQHPECGQAIEPHAPAGTFRHVASDGTDDHEQDADHAPRPALYPDPSEARALPSVVLCFTTLDAADWFVDLAGGRSWDTERYAVTTYSFTEEEGADRFIEEARARGWRAERTGLAEENMVTVYCPNLAEGRALADAIEPPPPGFEGEDVADHWVTVYCPDVADALALAGSVERNLSDATEPRFPRSQPFGDGRPLFLDIVRGPTGTTGLVRIQHPDAGAINVTVPAANLWGLSRVFAQMAAVCADTTECGKCRASHTRRPLLLDPYGGLPVCPECWEPQPGQ
jgi:hypothetical protein